MHNQSGDLQKMLDGVIRFFYGGLTPGGPTPGDATRFNLRKQAMTLGTHDSIQHTKRLALSYQPQELFSSALNSPDRYKLVFLRAGNGLLRVNNRQYPIMAPTVCCLTETDQIEFLPGTEITAESIYFHPTVINDTLTFEYLQSVNLAPLAHYQGLSAGRMDYDSLRPFHRKPGGGLYAIGPVSEQRLYALMQALRHQSEDRPDGYWPCRSRSYLQEILFLILQVSITQADLNHEHELPPGSPQITSLMLYLVNQYHHKITLNDVAKACGTNRNTLNQQCKQATGSTVMEYVLRLRVRRACQLLQDTSLPIAEIAERVGYADVTHFGRIFRKHMQLAPSDYRARQKGIP